MYNAPVFGAFLVKTETMSKRNIILIGFMGTGKTVTGRVLAERTGMELVDMDSIGEPEFRRVERELARELSQREGLIISTGGGVVLNPDNLEDFRSSGLVVCLTASPETIFQRLENDTTRPLLSGDKKEQISGILEARRPLYDAIEHQIDGDRLDPAGRADAILRLYELET